MGFWSNLTGGTSRSSHQDGSYTDESNEDWSRHVSTTYNSDGSVRETSSEHEDAWGNSYVETKDGDGNTINSQSKS